MSSDFNICNSLIHYASVIPDKIAISVPLKWDKNKIKKERQITYGELCSYVARLAVGLRENKVLPRSRVIIFFPVSIDMFALMISVFAVGAVPTFIDPGMGFLKVLRAIRLSDASAIATTPFLARVFRFALINKSIHYILYESKSSRSFKTLELVEDSNLADTVIKDYEGIITFTSGTGGEIKAVSRTHATLSGQYDLLKKVWVPHDDEVVLSCFPVSLFYYLSFGVTCCLPAVNLRAPGNVNPRVVVRQIASKKVTSIFSAPAFLEKITDYALSHQRLDGVTTVCIGGAPTPFRLLEKVNKCFSASNNFILYGSSESEPISFCPINEVLNCQPSRGYPVGGLVPGVNVKLVKMNHTLLQRMNSVSFNRVMAAENEVGEVIVNGPHVVEEYLHNSMANEKYKIRTEDGALWHRTGDYAYFDNNHQLFLVGRDIIKYHSSNLFPYSIEAHIDTISGVKQSALISYKGSLYLYIQLTSSSLCKQVTTNCNKALSDIGVKARIRLIKNMPVDSRHNSKINRNALINRFF